MIMIIISSYHHIINLTERTVILWTPFFNLVCELQQKNLLFQLKLPGGGGHIAQMPEQGNCRPGFRQQIKYFHTACTTFLNLGKKNKISFKQVFPLHHTPSLESLQKSWVRKIFGLQPLGEKRKFCVTSFFILYDRPGEISEYFGLKIAFYFAWLGHYTTALSIPAVVGGGFWVGFLLNPLSDYLLQMFQFFFHGRAEFLEDIGFVLFSLFNVIWATFYLEVSIKIISNQPSFQNFRPGSVALQSFHTNGVASNPGVFITHYYGRHCLIQG